MPQGMAQSKAGAHDLLEMARVKTAVDAVTHGAVDAVTSMKHTLEHEIEEAAPVQKVIGALNAHLDRDASFCQYLPRAVLPQWRAHQLAHTQWNHGLRAWSCTDSSRRVAW